MSKLYNGKANESKITKAFNHYANFESGELNIFQFFDTCDLILSIRDFSITQWCEPIWWKAFREFCNEKLKLKAIITSPWFEIFIMLVVLCNISIYTYIHIYIYICYSHLDIICFYKRRR